VSFDRILNEGGGTKDGNRAIFAYNLRRWQKPGDLTDVPRATSVGSNYGIEQSSRHPENGLGAEVSLLPVPERVGPSGTVCLSADCGRWQLHLIETLRCLVFQQ